MFLLLIFRKNRLYVNFDFIIFEEMKSERTEHLITYVQPFAKINNIFECVLLFLSLTKCDSANSERSEKFILCPKSDVRRPKLKVTCLTVTYHFERSEKSISQTIIFWQ